LCDILIISQGGRNSTLSSEGSPHEASQSDQGDDRGNNIGTSHRDQGGGRGAGFHDKQIAVDESSSKIHAA